jgi:AcrR family transcriptional regulator
MSKKLKIINQAMRLFAEKGYANASIAELAKLTQVAEGTIYYHFKTKETLFQSVLEDIEHTLIREFQIFPRESNFTSGMEKIEQSIFFYFILWEPVKRCFLSCIATMPTKWLRSTPYSGIIFQKSILFCSTPFKKALSQGIATAP